MTSIFDDIKAFFSGPSAEKCSKEEKKENDKHDAKVIEENERHKIALNKIKETASCKLNTTPSPSTISSPLQKTQAQDGDSTNDIKLDFNEKPVQAPKEPQEPQEPVINNAVGGRKRRTRRPRKRSGKNTRRPH
jgi:hypothetical protein